MKKIPTIFLRDPDFYSATRTPNPDCLWVFDPDIDVIARRKIDGTCCKIEGGKFYKRRDVRPNRTVPEGFIEVDHDENTGKRYGWIEVDPSDPENCWHMEAFRAMESPLLDGTYELIGPKIQGNKEQVDSHLLIRHDSTRAFSAPKDYLPLRNWLASVNIEGLVFYHPDGRMAKIKKTDFDLQRPAPRS